PLAFHNGRQINLDRLALAPADCNPWIGRHEMPGVAPGDDRDPVVRTERLPDLVCRLLLEKKNPHDHHFCHVILLRLLPPACPCLYIRQAGYIGDLAARGDVKLHWRYPAGLRRINATVAKHWETTGHAPRRISSRTGGARARSAW